MLNKADSPLAVKRGAERLASVWQAHRFWLLPLLAADLLFVILFLGGVVKYPRMMSSGGWISLNFGEIIVNGIWGLCNLLLLAVLLCLWIRHGKAPEPARDDTVKSESQER